MHAAPTPAEADLHLDAGDVLVGARQEGVVTTTVAERATCKAVEPYRVLGGSIEDDRLRIA